MKIFLFILFLFSNIFLKLNHQSSSLILDKYSFQRSTRGLKGEITKILIKLINIFNRYNKAHQIAFRKFLEFSMKSLKSFIVPN